MTLDVYGHSVQADQRGTAILDKLMALWKVGQHTGGARNWAFFPLNVAHNERRMADSILVLPCSRDPNAALIRR